MVIAIMTAVVVVAQSASTNTAGQSVQTTTPIKPRSSSSPRIGLSIATYGPVHKGENVWNLLSEGIVAAAFRGGRPHH